MVFDHVHVQDLVTFLIEERLGQSDFNQIILSTVEIFDGSRTIEPDPKWTIIPF